MKLRVRARVVSALCAACVLAPAPVLAQTFSPIGANLQKRANAVIALMGYTLTPDVTTGSLAINDGSAANPDFQQTSLGGGFTTSKDTPLYLEGNAGYARYDPRFLASDGTTDRSVPVQWKSLTATGGVGWDFAVARNLALRPIFNFSLGRVESDGAAAQSIIDNSGGDADLHFLASGHRNAYGLGGSLMLDYSHFRPESDVDVEVRYTNIAMRSFDSSPSVNGRANAQSLALWSRYRAPTGADLLERPLRYVLEYAYTRFYGDMDGALGFSYLHSFGIGLELDSSKYDILVARTRLLLRVKRGDNVSGYGLGLAVSF